MNQKLLSYAKLTIIMTGVWIVYSEKIDVQTVVTGAIASIMALLATDKLILKKSYSSLYHFHFLPMMIYAFRLLIAIYVAGFRAVVRMLTGRINVGIVDITTDLKDPFAVSLLANSITLTPGTVTLEQKDQNLKIIWLDPQPGTAEEIASDIKGPFEKLIRKAQR